MNFCSQHPNCILTVDTSCLTQIRRIALLLSDEKYANVTSISIHTETNFAHKTQRQVKIQCIFG